MSPCTSWLHIGDLHVSDEDGWESVERLKRIVAEVEANVPAGALAFTVLPGDNANHGEADQYDRIREVLTGLSMPIHVLPGDHDFEPGSLESFRRGVATEALPASVDLGGRRAIFLDIVSAGSGGPDFRLGTEQTVWLEGELTAALGAGEARPIVFMHAFPGDLHRGGRRIGRLFADAGVAFVDTGHTHYNELLNDGAVIYSATRSTGQVEEGEPGFAIGCVDGGAASWRFKALGSTWPFVLITSPADERLAVNGVEIDQTGGFTVRAKVFGREVAGVELTVADGAPVAMTPVEGEVALWSATVAARPDGLHAVSVLARDGEGLAGFDVIRVRTPSTRHAVRAPGEHRHSIGPWPEHGLLGSKLGPNANGRDW